MQVGTGRYREISLVPHLFNRDCVGGWPFDRGWPARGSFVGLRSNENGTVLERQFLLRGLFVEIFSGRALATRARLLATGSS